MFRQVKSREPEQVHRIRTVSGLLVALETFRGFSRPVCGGGEEVEEGALGMLSMFTGVGGALPERGRERPGRENRGSSLFLHSKTTNEIRVGRQEAGAYHRRGGGL